MVKDLKSAEHCWNVEIIQKNILIESVIMKVGRRPFYKEIVDTP